MKLNLWEEKESKNTKQWKIEGIICSSGCMSVVRGNLSTTMGVGFWSLILNSCVFVCLHTTKLLSNLQQFHYMYMFVPTPSRWSTYLLLHHKLKLNCFLCVFFFFCFKLLMSLKAYTCGLKFEHRQKDEKSAVVFPNQSYVMTSGVKIHRRQRTS